MGRPRKPTADLKLHGGFREDRHGNRSAESLSVGMPQKPNGMAPNESWLWDSVVNSLPPAALSSLDTAALIGLCWWWGRWRACSAALEDETIDPVDLGRLVRAGSKSWEHFTKLAAKFGLTPVDRARLQVDPSSDEPDEFEAFLKQSN